MPADRASKRAAGWRGAGRGAAASHRASPGRGAAASDGAVPGASSTRRGRAAESIAAAYLELAGYAVVGRNLRFGALEVDLLARRGNILAVIEVRYRRRPVGPPQESLPPEKWRRLMRAAVLAADAYANARARSDVIPEGHAAADLGAPARGGTAADPGACAPAGRPPSPLRRQVDLILIEGDPQGLHLRHIRCLPPHRPRN